MNTYNSQKSYNNASTESVGGHGWSGMDATTAATYSQMQSITIHHQEVEPLSSDHVHVMVYM